MVYPTPKFSTVQQRDIPIGDMDEDKKRELTEELERGAPQESTIQKKVLDKQMKTLGVDTTGKTTDMLDVYQSPIYTEKTAKPEIGKVLDTGKGYYIYDTNKKVLPNALKISGTRTLPTTELEAIGIESPGETVRTLSGVIRVELPVYQEDPLKPQPPTGPRGEQTKTIEQLKKEQERRTFGEMPKGIKQVYVKIDDMTRDEINTAVQDLKLGHGIRNRYALKEFPFISTAQHPLKFKKYGLDLEVEKTITEDGQVINPVTKFKENPLTTISKIYGGKLLGMVNDVAVGLPSLALAYGIGSAAQAYNFSVREVIRFMTGDKEQFFKLSEAAKKTSENITSIRDNVLSHVPNTASISLALINSGKGQVLTDEDIFAGEIVHTRKDLVGTIFQNRILFPEDFITNVIGGYGAYKAVDNIVLPLITGGTRGAFGAKKYKDLFAGDRAITLTDNLSKDISRVQDWARKNNKKWNTGKEMWVKDQQRLMRLEKNKTGVATQPKSKKQLEEEWNNMHPATKTPYINKSFQQYLDLRTQKEGNGLFNRFGRMFRQNRLEASTAPVAYAKANFLSEVYANTGGMLLQSFGVPAGYFIGAMTFGGLGTNVTSTNFFRNKIADTYEGEIVPRTLGFVGYGIDAFGNLSATSAIDAVLFALTKDAPIRRAQFDSAKERIRIENPTLTETELDTAVWQQYGVTSADDNLVVPQFYIANAAGEPVLANKDSAEYKNVENLITRINRELNPRQKKLLKEELQSYIQLQSEIATLIEKFPAKDKVTGQILPPEEHPLNKMSASIGDIINLATTRDLALSMADRVNFKSFGSGFELGRLEYTFQQRRASIQDTAEILQEAINYLKPEQLTESTNQTIQNLQKLLLEEQELADKVITSTASAQEYFKIVHNEGNYNYTQADLIMEGASDDIQDFFNTNGLHAHVRNVKSAKDAAKKADANHRKRIHEYINNIKNPDAWKEAPRSERVQFLINAKNDKLRDQGAAIYGVLNNKKFKNFKVESDDVDDFFVNTLDVLRKDPLEIFKGGGVKRPRSIVRIFQTQTDKVYDKFMDFAVREFGGEDIEVGEIFKSMREQLPNAQNVNFNNSIETYEYLVKNKNEGIVQGILKQTGRITLDIDTIAAFDRVFRNNLSKAKNTSLARGGSTELTETIKDYTELLGVGKTGDEGYEQGTLRRIIAENNGAEILQALEKIPGHYASVVAPRRWNKFVQLFEQYRRKDTLIEGTEGIEGRGSTIDYQKNTKDVLAEFGQLMLEDPLAAATMLKQTFGSAARVPNNVGELQTAFVIAKAEDADAARIFTKLALDEHLRREILKIHKKYQIDLQNPEPTKYNQDFVNEINQVVGEGLLPNKNVGQKIQNFNNQFKNVNGTQVWDGTLKDNGDLNFVNIDDTDFAVNIDGNVVQGGKFADQKVKNFFDDEDIGDLINDGDFYHAIKYDNKSRVAHNKMKIDLQRAKSEFDNKTKLITLERQRDYKQLSDYIAKTFNPKAAIGDKISGDPVHAAEYLFKTGDISYVRGFQTKLAESMVKSGSAKNTQEAMKKSREFIGRLLRNYFFDYVSVKTGGTRVVREGKDKLINVAIKMPSEELVNEAFDKFGTILKEFIHPDLKTAEAILPLFESVAKKFSMLRLDVQGGGMMGRKVGRATGVPSAMAVEALASRGFALNREVIGPRWVALELSMRAARLKKAGGLRGMLVTAADTPTKDGRMMIEVIHDMIIENKYTPKNINAFLNTIPNMLAKSDLDIETYNRFGYEIPFFGMGDREEKMLEEKQNLRTPENIKGKEDQPIYRELKELELIQ